MAIVKINSTTYETVYRGRVYTLVQDDIGYSMWNNRIGCLTNPPKPFNSLKDVEKRYKHWRGITALVEIGETPTN